MTVTLGVDPGYEQAGIAVSVDGTPLIWDYIKFPGELCRAGKRQLLDRRLQDLGMVFDQVVYEEQWSHAGVSFVTAVIDFAYRHKIPVYAVNSRSWKKAFFGSANAPKERSVEYARTWTGDPKLKNHNCADGVCISICGYKHPELLKKPE